MVFFTCSHCGESVKKPTVSKHYQTKCKKKDPFLTCVDCLKDFKGNEYEAHTKCLTEEEKYSAKGHVPKASQNKGERKQQAWQECMQTVLKKPTLKPDERDLIRAISKYENVPRKKAKFLNFLTHAFKQYANKNDLIDRVWAEMESVFKEMSASAAEANKQQLQKQQQQQKQAKPPKPEAKPAAKNATTKGNIKAEDNAVKKEKKRKRPNEDEKGEAATEISKADDKQKKKKQKSTEEKKVEGNNDNVMLICDEFETKPENINRKRKADEDSQTESNNFVADETEPGKKKKKKKPNENQVNATAAPTTKAEDNSKSKKKPKKPQNANPETKTNADNAKGGATDPNAVKKEKKPKKSENKENVAEKQPTAKTAAKPAGAKPAAGKPAANANANAKPPLKTAVKTPKSDQSGEAEKTAPKPKKGKTETAPAPAADDKQEQFDWKATILQVLNQDGKNNRIQLQKLQKKVLKLHCQILNCEISEKKEKKFMKKLKEMQELTMEKDFVVLKS